LLASLKKEYKFITNLSLNYGGLNCRLGDQGIDLLVQAELFFITDLSLEDNNITHLGVKQMGRCKWKDL
jgi:hypothetical protein